MNKLKRYSPPLVHKLITVCAVALAVAGSWAKPATKSQSPVVHLAQVDHYDSLTTTNLENYPTPNPVAEFNWVFQSEHLAAARVRSTAGTLRLKWANTTGTNFSGYAIVHEARYRYLKRNPTGPPTYEDIEVDSDPTPVPVIVDAYNISSDVFLVLGDLPNVVLNGNLQLRIELRGNIGLQLPGEPDSLAWGHENLWTDFGIVYLTAETPTGIQQVPWLEVLAQACLFAQERIDEVAVRREVTKGIFYETKEYDGFSPLFTTRDTDANLSINLKKYFDPDTKKMDCQDGASLNVTFCEALGYHTNLIFYWTDMDPTNNLCPAGTDSKIVSNYSPYHFNFHAVALNGNSVYDSVTAQWVDLNGNLWADPVWDWNFGTYPQVPALPPATGTYGYVSLPRPYDYVDFSIGDVIQIL